MTGWLVIVEAIGKLIAMAIERWGQPTEEVKAKLLSAVTLPVPGEAEKVLAEIDAEIRSTATVKVSILKDVIP